jgi:hypothetical protein
LLDRTTMQKEPHFTSKDDIPGNLKLKRVLGNMFLSYQEILKLTEELPFEWKYYGKKFGWQLKVVLRGKALLYLVPLKNSFRLGFAVREQERDALLNSKLAAKAKAELAMVKKYHEGYPLRLTVRKGSEMKSVRLIIKTLKSIRK